MKTGGEEKRKKTAFLPWKGTKLIVLDCKETNDGWWNINPRLTRICTYKVDHMVPSHLCSMIEYSMCRYLHDLLYVEHNCYFVWTVLCFILTSCGIDFAVSYWQDSFNNRVQEPNLFISLGLPVTAMYTFCRLWVPLCTWIWYCKI